MNRTIKFRALLKGQHFKGWQYFALSDIRNFEIYDPETLCQFTGLLDKNGKEIYEGDILKYTRKHWYCPRHPQHDTDLIDQVEVYWDEERNSMSRRTFDFERLKRNPNQAPYSSSGFLGNGWNDERADKNIVEIIGNIHSNPELLSN